MKKLLADDDQATLDVYSASLGQHLLGWAASPPTSASSPRTRPLPRFFDGVVIDFRSVPQPEGNTEGDTRVFPDGTYEEGDTLTHEVGHWLELYHTFQGGCPTTATTAATRSPTHRPRRRRTSSAPRPGTTRATPARRAGPGPVNNFMDYSFDSCLTEFTPEQAARMQFAWETYRS